MKKILRPVMAIFLLLSLCFTTSSCGAGNNEEAYDRSELTGVKNRVEYALPDDHNSGIMPCGEAIKNDTYDFCYSEDSNLYTLDLATGERGHVDLSPVCPGLLTIDDRLYVQDTATNCIAAYDVTTLSKSNNIELPTSASAVTAIDCYDGALYLTSETSLFVSKKGDKYGFVDSQGNVVVDYIYDDATEQNQYGFAAIKQNELWGSIDKGGKVVMQPKVDLDGSIYTDFIGEWHLADEGIYYTK